MNPEEQKRMGKLLEDKLITYHNAKAMGNNIRAYILGIEYLSLRNAFQRARSNPTNLHKQGVIGAAIRRDIIELGKSLGLPNSEDSYLETL